VTRLLCSTGCGLPVHHRRGQCVAHIDSTHVPGHPWTPCAKCGRALDWLLGSAATVEDVTCDNCKGKTNA
jgi:hypothetical protein